MQIGDACDTPNDADSIAGGTWVCVNGVWHCDDDRSSIPEECDAIDNDGDGRVDEGLSDERRVCDNGLPGFDAIDICVDGVWECKTIGDPMPEVCDAQDNDGDGRIDEDISLENQCDGDDADLCATGTSICHEGVIHCVDDELQVETCNGVDDDCDGVIDESFPSERCDGMDADQCLFGQTHCIDGTVICMETNQEQIETCNGVDDDCDGVTDEGSVLLFACDGDDDDQCADGVTQCVQGAEICVEDSMSKTEICNGVDDDCDGEIDEDSVCGCWAVEGEDSVYLDCSSSVQPGDVADAEAYCESVGYRLVKIDSAAENMFVRSLIPMDSELWLGLFRVGNTGDFAWADGTQAWQGGANGMPIPGVYQNFIRNNFDPPDNEPDGASPAGWDNVNCVRMVINGGWRDENCDAEHHIVCERSK